MTYAAVPALRVDESVAKEWVPLLAATSYDPGVRAASSKSGALAGMGMTEKQGGSDVRANVTEARPTGSGDGGYTLHGHKWFTPRSTQRTRRSSPAPADRLPSLVTHQLHVRTAPRRATGSARR